MSVLPALIVVVAITLAPVSQLPSEVGSTYSRTQSPVGRDISTLTSLIPANMFATVLVPNLSKLSHQILSTQLMGYQNKDPYRSFMASLEIVDGIDDDGAGAIGIMSDALSVDMWQNMAIWLPANNVAAMMTFMQPIQISAGIYRVTIAGHASFAAEHGDFLLLSPRLEIINACVDSREAIRRRLSAHQLRTLDDADLALVTTSSNQTYSMSGGVGNRLNWLASWPGLSAFQDAMSPSASSRHVPMWSLSIKPNGLEMSMVGHSRRDEGGSQANAARPRPIMSLGTDLLLALPSESTVAAIGFEPKSAILASSGFVDLFLGYLQQRNIANASPADELLRTLKRSISRASVGAMAFQSSATDGKAYRATLILQTNIEAGIIRAEFQSLVSQLKRGFFVDPLWQGVADRLQILPMASSYQGVQIDHLSIDGLSADKFKGSLHRPSSFPTDGVIARMAVIDNSAFVLVVGGDEQGIHDVIERWRDHQAPLLSNATIVSYAVARRSPVSAEGYISSDGIRRLRGLPRNRIDQSDVANQYSEESWATFSSFNVEVGVERFNVFLPYSWLDLIMQQDVMRN